MHRSLLLLTVLFGCSPKQEKTGIPAEILNDSTLTRELEGPPVWRRARMLKGVVLVMENKLQEALDAERKMSDSARRVYAMEKLNIAPFWRAEKKDTSLVILEYAYNYNAPDMFDEEHWRSVYLLVPDVKKLESGITYVVPNPLFELKMWYITAWVGQLEPDTPAGSVTFFNIDENFIVAELKIGEKEVDGKYLFRLKPVR